jgi:hypothetical protein
MFGNYVIADLIAYRCSRIDNFCRLELNMGNIISETDYVSVFSSRIRDEFRRDYSCYAQTIRQGLETENGVDGIIIFKFGDEVKVGWYEAKWPRVGQANYTWDKVPPTKDISHFSEQLIKQHRLDDTLALWEMFFNEQPEGYLSPPYATFGSSCAWHLNTYDFMRSEGIIFEPWTTEKLKLHLITSCINFYDIIFDILSCRKGKKIILKRGQNSIQLENPNNKNDILEIPLPQNISSDFTDNISSRDNDIASFMEKRNIAGYLLIDLLNK